MPPLRRHPLAVFGTLALLACSTACDCGPTGVEQLVFACSESSPCGPGFECVLGECRAPGSDAGPAPDDGGTVGDMPDAGLKATFLSGPLLLRVGECSPAVTLGVLDGAGALVPGPRTLTVSSTAPGGLFFASATCAAPAVTTAQVPAGLASAQVFFSSPQPGSFVLSASGVGVAPAQQALTVQPSNMGRLSFAAGANRVRAGACLPATVEVRDAVGALAVQASALSVALASAPRALAMFAGSSCMGPQVSGVTVAAGQSSAAFSVQSPTGGTTGVTASATGLMSASLSVTVLPLVRTSSCAFAAGQGQAACALDPPQTAVAASQVYLFPTGPAGPTAGSGAVEVRCTFATDGTQLNCQRFNTTVPVSLQVATVELPGATVQTVNNVCDGGGSYDVALPTAVNPNSSFVLTQGISGGVLYDEFDTFTASIVSGNTLQVRYPASCPPTDPGFFIQVVSQPAALVTRGFSSMLAGETSVTVAAAQGPGVVQHTARTSGSMQTDPLCDRLVRGEPVAGGVAFTRGLLDAGSCATQPVRGISWERIDYRAQASKVLNVPFSMDAGAATATVSLAGQGFVDRTRTLVFMGQGAAGQGMGEVEACAFSDLGAALASWSLDGPADGGVAVDSITFRRGNTNATARWTAHVVQFEP